MTRENIDIYDELDRYVEKNMGDVSQTDIAKHFFELGQKDAIDKACEWLNKNLSLCIDYDDEGNLILDTKNFVDYFKMRIEQNYGKFV